MTICIATRVHQRTRVSFEQLACHTRVAYINSRVHLSLALKKYKTRLYEISWALILNYPNFFNHLSLQNHSISQSINRGLVEGINKINIREKSYAGGTSSEVLEQQNLESFGCIGFLVSEVGLYYYLIH